LNKSNHLKSIAVLPFTNMSDKREGDFFADGITEEIINALTRIPELKVTSRTSSFFFKNKTIPITQIARELGVKLILEGSIRFGGSKVRITAQLIQAEDDFHFWSDVWDRELDDIFQIQDEISLLIAEKAREILGHFELQDHLVQVQTEHYQAYEWFLKGRFHFRQWNVEEVKKALECYEEALKVDPRHAESLMGKADALGFLATTGFIPREEAWKDVEKLIEKTLQINPNLAEAYYQQSQLRFFYYCDFQGALQSCLKAKSIHPNHPETNQQLSFLYLLAGKNSIAKEYLDHSLNVDPLSQETQFFDAYFDYMTKNFDAALIKLKALFERNPYNIPTQSVLCYCLLKTGKYEEAYHFFDTLPGEMIVEEDKLGIQALAAILMGNESLSSELIKELEARALSPEGFRADSFLLFVYSLTGDTEKLYTWIENAISKKSSLLLIHLNDPFVQGVAEEERYQTYLKEVYGTIEESDDVPEKKTLLDKREMDFFKQKLTDLLEKENVFTDSELTLKTLADKAELHPNKLSWLINEGFDSNFNSLINSYRVKRFKELVEKGEHLHYSIIGLAYECGFNSKTVFNTYFKKETGMTPKQFIQG